MFHANSVGKDFPAPGLAPGAVTPGFVMAQIAPSLLPLPAGHPTSDLMLPDAAVVVLAKVAGYARAKVVMRRCARDSIQAAKAVT